MSKINYAGALVAVRAQQARFDWLARLRRDQRGLVSAEWVLGIVAAAALAGVLLAIVTDGQIEKNLLTIVLDVIGRLTGILDERMR